MRGMALVACLVMAACGSDARPSKIVPEQAAVMVRQTAQFRAVMATNDGFATASALHGLAAQGSIIVQPDEEQATRAAPGVKFAVGTCSCDEGGCTFNGCGDDAGSWTADGTIVINAGVYTFDIDWEMQSGSGITQTWSINGALTMSDTSIEGRLSGRGLMVIDDPEIGEHLELETNWDVDFKPALVDAMACAIGGKLGVDGEIIETVRGRDFRWAKTGTVAFGPACGVAVLE